MKAKLRFACTIFLALSATSLLSTYMKLKIKHEREDMMRVKDAPPEKSPASSSLRTTPSEKAATVTPRQPVLLLMLTYQRCGSSFMGNIFNSNPDGFYVYEPLDATYVHLYGTRLGWNSHGDITHHRNLSRRHIPELELNSMADTIRGLLTCDVTNMWPEVVYNKFWLKFAFLQDLAPFQNCLRSKNVSIGDCQTKLGAKNTCGMYFDPEISPPVCAAQLHGNQRPNNKVRQYMACIKSMDNRGQPCRKHLYNICSNSSVHSVKTVRANMEVAEKLLHQLPNLKVMHLVRDPRPVALSRGRNPTYRSHFSGSPTYWRYQYNIVREAALYCDSVLSDIRKRQELARAFPGQVMEVIFEEFVQEPLSATSDIYEFLNVPMHQNVSKWLDDHTDLSQRIARKWQKSNPGKGVWESIYNHKLCKELFEEYSDVWLPWKSPGV